MQQEDKKFYFMKTQGKVSKNGKRYHQGKFAYAIDIIGFEKDDGTITWWLSPKDMDQMKQQTQAKQGNHPYSPKPQPQAPPLPLPQQRYTPKPQPQSEPPPWDDPMPDDSDLPF